MIYGWRTHGFTLKLSNFTGGSQNHNFDQASLFGSMSFGVGNMIL